MEHKRNASVSDVAREAGVSVATVSYVLAGRRRLRPDTEARVREAAARLGYVPNRAARSLVTGSSQLIGAIVTDMMNPFFAPVLRAIEDEAAHHGYLLMVGNSDEQPEKEQAYLRLLDRYYVDGVILSPTREVDQSLRVAPRLSRFAVAINRRPRGVSLDLVATDNREGARLATELLLDRGHRRIAILIGPQEVSTHSDRLQGYLAAHAARGISPEPALIWQAGYTAESGYTTALSHLQLRPLPDALFCASGVIAAGTWRAVQELGIRVPDDVSLVGFDDPDWARLVTPPLTTVSQPTYEMGRKAAELLMRRLQSPDEPGARVEVLLAPMLVERGSVASR